MSSSHDQDTQLIRVQTRDVTPYIVLGALVVCVLVFSALFFWMYRIGHSAGLTSARVDACTHWCDVQVSSLTQPEYLGCLEQCTRWSCDGR